MKTLLALALAAAFGTAQAACPPAAIHVLRHAEKDLSNPADKNPPLSPAGQARAQKLADAFRGVRVDAIYTTDFRRTRATVAPLASQARLAPAIYDPRDPKVFAGKLRHEHCGQTVVVAGHSNTVPALLTALGAGPRPEIPESRYGDRYSLRFPDGKPALEAGRYGD
ncbi:MAG: histidine phosphatase family protein [Gammaproteobacteria bacterium]|nr:histidine phosphatase family protein [Gammaproteobacteria bacterium]